jgi:hypothetical protein
MLSNIPFLLYRSAPAAIVCQPGAWSTIAIVNARWLPCTFTESVIGPPPVICVEPAFFLLSN